VTINIVVTVYILLHLFTSGPNPAVTGQKFVHPPTMSAQPAPTLESAFPLAAMTSDLLLNWPLFASVFKAGQ